MLMVLRILAVWLLIDLAIVAALLAVRVRTRRPAPRRVSIRQL